MEQKGADSTGSQDDIDDNAEARSKEAKDEQVDEKSALAAISSLLMPKELYLSYKSALDDTIIDNIYNTLTLEQEKERLAQREVEKKKEDALARKIIDEAPMYTKSNDWAEEEDEVS